MGRPLSLCPLWVPLASSLGNRFLEMGQNPCGSVARPLFVRRQSVGDPLYAASKIFRNRLFRLRPHAFEPQMALCFGFRPIIPLQLSRRTFERGRIGVIRPKKIFSFFESLFVCGFLPSLFLCRLHGEPALPDQPFADPPPA